MTRGLTIVGVATIVVACNSPSDPGETTVAGADGAPSAIEAVEAVVDSLSSGDFESAGAYAVPDHAALAALAEGASFADVAEALRGGDTEVAANFWSGFAQGAGSFLTGTVSYFDDDSVSSDGLEFKSVRLLPPDGSQRILWVRDVDGYRVDLFASFGGGLADKMLGPIERLLAAQTDDTRFILASLTEVVPSLLVAAETPGVTIEIRQQILSVVELITRVG